MKASICLNVVWKLIQSLLKDELLNVFNRMQFELVKPLRQIIESLLMMDLLQWSNYLKLKYSN